LIDITLGHLTKVFQILHDVEWDGNMTVNCGWERIWKETGVFCLKVLPKAWRDQGKRRKISVMMAGIAYKIQIGYFASTFLVSSCYSNQLCVTKFEFRPR